MQTVSPAVSEFNLPDVTPALLAEIADDQAIQQADAAHLRELRAAYAYVKDRIGTAAVSVSRRIIIDDDLGRLVQRSQWACLIAHGKGSGPG